MTSKKRFGDVKFDFLKSIAAYVGTGILGAAVTYGITAFNRLPSRALTILPAGIHIIEGPIVSCDDTQFIIARVNAYVDPEVKIPPCDVLLSKAQADDLVEGLQAAKQYYQSERINYFQRAKARLTAIAKNPPQSEDKLKEATLAAIGDLKYISASAPNELNGTSLLQWAQSRIDNVISDVSAEFVRIESILNKLRDGGTQQARHTEFYFLATNASDVEFYVSTGCTVQQASLSAKVVLEKVDRDDILYTALVYMPVLPGRGRLMKYTPRDEKEIEALLSKKGSIELICNLSNDRTIETKEFDPVPFIALERTYVTPKP
jgi:hypothetical protein